MTTTDKRRYASKISELKQKTGAVILAHNYTVPEIQDVADFVGDSLQLSITARDAGADLMVFCGVLFMAENAKILSPSSRVLIPVQDAGCPLADMAQASAVADWRRNHPNGVIVAYVNSSAEVKAESDICCTSANAESVVASIPEGREILFLPDRNLGANVSAALGRKMTLWPGFCPVHNAVEPDTIASIKSKNPGFEVLVHPECRPDVLSLADHSLSTGGMTRHVRSAAHGCEGFVICTECGILHRLEIENPGVKFVTTEPPLVCSEMKKIDLEDLFLSLEYDRYEVILPEGVAERARRPIERMIALG